VIDMRGLALSWVQNIHSHGGWDRIHKVVSHDDEVQGKRIRVGDMHDRSDDDDRQTVHRRS